MLLGGVPLLGAFLMSHDWEWGLQRSLVLAVFALLVFLVRSPDGRLPLRSPPLVILLWAFALVLFGHHLLQGLDSMGQAARQGDVRMDQGQDTLRAARVLRRGENPYGRGQLLDPVAFDALGPSRAAVGLSPALEPSQIHAVFARYWATLDPSLRARLLPPSEAVQAQVELSRYGYKYGPLLPLLTAPVEARLGAAALPLLQLVLWAFWMLLLALCLTAAGVEVGAVPLALLVLGLEPTIAHDFLFLTASDIWALAALTGALLAFLHDRDVALGLCAAAALGCKAFPGVLAVPLLLARGFELDRELPFVRRHRALLVSILALGALYLPFFLWDPRGLWTNLVVGPARMTPDNTGWAFYAPRALLPLVRACLALALLGLCVWFVRRKGRHPFAFLALASALAILQGATFHNNYASWFTGWAACAITTAFFGTRAPVKRA